MNARPSYPSAAAPARRHGAEKSVARKLRFAQTFQRDLGSPDPFAKIFRFAFTPNQRLFPRRPVSIRAAYRDRLGSGMGCDGRGSVGRERGLQGGLITRERSTGASTPNRLTDLN